MTKIQSSFFSVIFHHKVIIKPGYVRREVVRMCTGQMTENTKKYSEQWEQVLTQYNAEIEQSTIYKIK
jgi:hypothetical protein